MLFRRGRFDPCQLLQGFAQINAGKERQDEIQECTVGNTAPVCHSAVNLEDAHEILFDGHVNPNAFKDSTSHCLRIAIIPLVSDISYSSVVSFSSMIPPFGRRGGHIWHKQNASLPESTAVLG